LSRSFPISPAIFNRGLLRKRSLAQETVAGEEEQTEALRLAHVDGLKFARLRCYVAISAFGGDARSTADASAKIKLRIPGFALYSSRAHPWSVAMNEFASALLDRAKR